MRKISYGTLLFLFTVVAMTSCGLFDNDPPAYTLTTTVSPEEGGTITPESGKYADGETVTLTGNPNSGWGFVRWEGDWSSSQNPTTIIMNRDMIMIGVFERMEVTNPLTGRVWMDRNLGASRAATSSTDSQAYGDLYQWGRLADGHQIIHRFEGDGKTTSGLTGTLSSSDQPGHGSFILAPNSPWDWRSPQNNNLWQGTNGTNNPCPAGYRLPTEAEWNAERGSWSTNNASGALNSPLKLPMAGYRGLSSGSLGNVGSNGYYWSSTVSGSNARNLYFNSSNARMFSNYRAYGDSVRCLKDY